LNIHLQFEILLNSSATVKRFLQRAGKSLLQFACGFAMVLEGREDYFYDDDDSRGGKASRRK